MDAPETICLATRYAIRCKDANILIRGPGAGGVAKPCVSTAALSGGGKTERSGILDTERGRSASAARRRHDRDNVLGPGGGKGGTAPGARRPDVTFCDRPRGAGNTHTPSRQAFTKCAQRQTMERRPLLEGMIRPPGAAGICGPRGACGAGPGQPAGTGGAPGRKHGDFRIACGGPDGGGTTPPERGRLARERIACRAVGCECEIPPGEAGTVALTPPRGRRRKRPRRFPAATLSQFWDSILGEGDAGEVSALRATDCVPDAPLGEACLAPTDFLAWTRFCRLPRARAA